MTESNAPSEIKRTLRAVLQKTTSEHEAHPDPDRLFAFSAGALTAEEEEAMRDHLSLCRDCLDRLWLDPEDPLARDRRGVADLETHRAWREMAAKIREIQAAKRLERERRRSRLYQLAAAACLVLAAGLAWKVSTAPPAPSPSGAARPPGPTVNVDVFDVTYSSVRSGSGPALDSPEASGRPGTTPLSIPEGFESVTLIFTVGSGDYESYELKILDSDKKEVWESRDVIARNDLVTLALPREAFGAGEYLVEIYGRRGAQATVWEYPIHLLYR